MDERQGETNGQSSSDKPFTQHIHHRAIEMWEAGPKLIAQLGQVQLPEAVDVTVRQAKS
jgi:Ribosomal protein S10p/S20e.